MYKYLAIVFLLAGASLSSARAHFPYAKNDFGKQAAEPLKGFNNGLMRSDGSGYLLLGETEYGLAVDSHKTDFIKFSLINGYQFNPFFSLGFGAGIKFYLVENDPDIVVPLFLDFRVYFTDRKISPYLALGTGYAIDFGYEMADGQKHYIIEAGDLLLNPAAGVIFKISGRYAINIGIGYEMQSMRFYDDDLHFTKSTANSSCIGISAGISFLAGQHRSFYD